MEKRDDIRPLVKKWLKDWEAGSSVAGSKMKFVYKNASKSLVDHKEPVYTSLEFKKIKFFGDKLCKRIDDALKAHYTELGIEIPEEISSQASAVSSQIVEPSQKAAKTTSKKRDYLPKPGTGSFAILVALYTAEIEDGLSTVNKSDLINRAQVHSNESMTAKKPGSHYNSWNSMKTLIDRNLVLKEQHRSAFYSLTSEGKTLAEKLVKFLQDNNKISIVLANDKENQLDDDSENSFESLTSTATSSTSTSSFRRTTLLPNTFDIVLLVDSREQTSGVAQGMKKTALISELQRRGINAQMRVLQAGDFAWVARENIESQNSNSKYGSSVELILDVIIERKRADDLESSIKDGRWHEQKYRLKKSGLRQPTYLIEGLDPKKAHHHSIPFRNLHQAVVNSQIVDGFSVKQTKDYEESVNYLVTLTNYLTKTLGDKTLNSCSLEEIKTLSGKDHFYMTFSEYERNTRKVTNFTVTEMFIKHMLQIKGVSLAKAKAIVDYYPTIKSLLEAYEDCATEREREFLLSKLKFVLANWPIPSAETYAEVNVPSAPQAIVETNPTPEPEKTQDTQLPKEPENDPQLELITKCDILEKEVLRTRKLCQLYKEKYEKVQEILDKKPKTNGFAGDAHQIQEYEDVDLQGSPFPSEDGGDNAKSTVSALGVENEGAEKEQSLAPNAPGIAADFGEELAPCTDEPPAHLVDDSALQEVSRLREELVKVSSDQQHWRQLAGQNSQRNSILQDDLKKSENRIEELERLLCEERTKSSDYNKLVREQQAAFHEEKGAVANELEELDQQHQQALDKVLAIRDQLAKTNNDLVQQIFRLKGELTECQSSKESLKETASRLKNKVVDKEEDINKLYERIHELEMLQAGRVDKQVMKSLFLGYFGAPGDKKNEVALLLARILDFTEDEIAKCKLVAGPGWLGGQWAAGESPLASQSLASQFVTFLESESRREEEQMPKTSKAVKSMAKDFQKFALQPENGGIKRNPFIADTKPSTAATGNQLFDKRIVVPLTDLPIIVSSSLDNNSNTENSATVERTS
ncbi:Crossover junction endonuclease MUS81 [Halotydeus destructor]|nr:Crossover junction endonuclease MUS81 [Halotydeus destructor]